MTMPMDKNDKKKALELMIVLGAPKGKKMNHEGMEDDHKGCKCPCCGMPCKECNNDGYESEDESKSEDYED
jgi:hypothetical protein